jgi:hypothetical protein
MVYWHSSGMGGHAALLENSCIGMQSLPSEPPVVSKPLAPYRILAKMPRHSVTTCRVRGCS